MESQSAAPHPFSRNERGCRCCRDGTSASPGVRSVPEGYCGWCEVCGEPGHRRWFPGCVPFRGSWCDRHHEQLRRLHPCGGVGIVYWTLFAWTTALGVLGWFVV